MVAYTFSDVLIKPKYSNVTSRSNVKLNSKLHNVELELPIISANMKTITGSDMAKAMHDNGGLGILHRFCTIDEAVDQFKAINNPKVGVSIDVQDEDKERFEKLFLAGAKIFCIDVAHGHHIRTLQMLRWINDEMFKWDRSHRKDLTIIAGNVATPEGATFLVNEGADVVKVGVGPGFACRTRKNTGVGVPQLYALETIKNKLSSTDPDIGIIADGGCSTVGDIAKALKFADAVMLGYMLAGTVETPGKVYKAGDGQYYKFYAGSASAENKDSNGQTVEYVEGISTTVPFNGKVEYILKEIKDGIKSAFSYVGASNMDEYKKYCEFIEISAGGKAESRL